MDFVLFSSLIRNLLKTPVSQMTQGEDTFAAFQDKYCYNPALQPIFTAKPLSALFADVEEKMVYEYQDELGVNILFFRFGGEAFLVGPFVRQAFDERLAQRTLILNGMPGAFSPSVKLYYESFPLVAASQAINTVLACIRSFTGATEDYSICRLALNDGEVQMPRTYHIDSLDYSGIYRRYDTENRFLRMIETGDTENVLIGYNAMSLDGLTEKSRYVNAVYQTPTISLAMVRALVRKAAERGGAGIVEINEITQRTVQKMASTNSMKEMNELTREMILDLTVAVRQHKLQLGKYSPPIRKAVEYLYLNYSQNVTLAQLAAIAGYADTYFSKSFTKEVGTPVFQYIAQLRCMHAAEMLKGSEFSVQEISAYVGYIDSNYFVKVFKKQYGVTPSDYRLGKQNRAESF